MDKLILILVIVGGIFLAGSCAAGDISTGPRAEGLRSVYQAEADRIEARTRIEQAQEAEDLRDQQQVNDATREARVRTVKSIQLVLGLVGSFALALALIMGAVNIGAFMSLINFRFALKPIKVKSGPQVSWVLPVVPSVLYLTNEDAPGVTTRFGPDQVPQLTEPRNAVGIALASALKRGFIGAYTVPAMQQLADMLNGRRLLPGPDQ